MRKYWIFLSLLLIVSLAACNTQQGTNSPTAAAPSATEASEVTSPTTVVSTGPVEPAQCRVVGLFDFPDVPQPASIPPVDENDWVFGNADAPVTILEYSEMQCPYCGQLEPILLDLQSQYPDDVRLVFRHFPLNIHDKATLAAHAVEAAAKQDKTKFFELKNYLFENQSEWSAMSVDDFRAYVIKAAGDELKLDTAQFEIDLDDAGIAQKVQDIAQTGTDAGVSYTPYVTIDGFPYEGNRDVESLHAMVEAYKSLKAEYGEEVLAGLPAMTINTPDSVASLVENYNSLLETYGAETLATIPSAFLKDSANLEANVDYYLQLEKDRGQEFIATIPAVFYTDPTQIKEYISLYTKLYDSLNDKIYDSCPPQVVDPAKQYTATISTSKGDIVIELYPDKAPTTVNSFVFLAQNGWFDNNTFYRVLSGFVAQTGDPSGLGLGGPGYEFGDEISADLSFDKAGVVGMANSGANTNGSQFFITLDAVPQLDGGYTIFGQVTEGLDVLQTLTPRDPSLGTDLPDGDVITSITIEEK